jgi:hypothetical protein
MARNLYSAYRSAGTSSGQYKASLFDVESKSDKMAFADKRGAWEQEKLSRNVETIGAGLELASTIAGGLKDRQDFKGELKAVGKEYGELQPDARSFGQKLFGAEREYTFGEGKDARTFSKAGVGVQGGRLLGESMLDEAGIGFGKTETPLDDLNKKSGDDTKSGSKYDEMMSRIQQYRKDKWAPDETIDMSLWDLGEKSITNPLGVGDDDTKISFIN